MDYSFSTVEPVTLRRLREENKPYKVAVGTKHCKVLGSSSKFYQEAVKAKPGGGVKRKGISVLSRKSQARGQWMFEEILSSLKWTSFLTFTYNSIPKNGLATKQHLKEMLDELRKNDKGLQFKCFWWMEFQARGAIHFHAAFEGLSLFFPEEPGIIGNSHYKLPKDVMVYCRNSMVLCRIWSSIIGETNKNTLKHSARWERVKSAESLPCYLAKYLAKHEQKHVPEALSDVGRFWGTRGCSALKADARGCPRFWIPGHLLAGNEHLEGNGVIPYVHQWRGAETLRHWLASQEGIEYQRAASELLWANVEVLLNTGNTDGELLPCPSGPLHELIEAQATGRRRHGDALSKRNNKECSAD